MPSRHADFYSNLSLHQGYLFRKPALNAMADVELDAPGLDLDAFRSLESNDFQAGVSPNFPKANFLGWPFTNNDTQ